MMASFEDEKNVDFSVISNSNSACKDVIKKYIDLKDSISRDELNSRGLSNEELESLIIKFASSEKNNSNSLFRKSGGNDDFKVSKWLFLVRNKAMRIGLENDVSFSKMLSPKDMRQISKFSKEPKNLKNIRNFLLNEYGIILIVEQYFSRMKVDGCCFKLPDGVPVIGISVRFNRYDNFWFTLMHELAHVSLHYDYLDEAIVDDLEEHSTEEKEVEANRIARDSLVPRSIFKKAMLEKGRIESLYKFSREASVHPSILAGLIRYKTGRWNLFSKEIGSIDVRQELNSND